MKNIFTPAGEVFIWMMCLIIVVIVAVEWSEDPPWTACDERSASDCHMREHHE